MEKSAENSPKEDELTKKRFNISCCRSYLTPKGRCYTCPELDYADERSEEISGDAEMQKDPDAEKW